MKALVYTKYGGPDELHIREVDKPSPRADEVLVKVQAVSINDWDWGLLQKDFFNRMFSGFTKPKRTILGSDIAGTVEAVGADIKKFQPGDKVYGDLSGQWGGMAEYVCAREKALCPMPAGMGFIEAAAIPQAGMLAVQGLIDVGQIRTGQKILINGAGGGVGTFGIQIARQFGVEVTGVDSGAKLEMMRSLGFDHVIDYRQNDFTKGKELYHLIVDTKTNRPVFHYLRVLSPHGKYITVGGSIPRLLQVVLLKPYVRIVHKKQVGLVMLKPNKDLPYMNGLFEAGKIRAVIDGPYPLEEGAEAFRRFGRGEHKGKVVLTIGG